MNTMSWGKSPTTIALVLVLGLSGVGDGRLANQATGAEPPAPDAGGGRPQQDDKPVPMTTAVGGLQVLHEVESARLESGATLDLCNAAHEFVDVPAEWNGRRYTKRHGFQGILRFRVMEPQWIAMALYGNDWGGGGNAGGNWLPEVVSRDNLERQGWKEVARLRSRETAGQKQEAPWIVFARECNTGETFAIRNHKYLAPFLIFGSPAPAPATKKKEGGGLEPSPRPIDLGTSRFEIEPSPATNCWPVCLQ